MIRPTTLRVRHWTALVAVAAGLAFAASTASARMLDPSNPDDAILAAQKMNCSLVEGEAIVYWWKGAAYSRVPG